MQDPKEQIQYRIVIGMYLIIAKESDMHYWNHFETSVGALDKGNLHNYCTVYILKKLFV